MLRTKTDQTKRGPKATWYTTNGKVKSWKTQSSFSGSRKISAHRKLKQIIRKENGNIKTKRSNTKEIKPPKTVACALSYCSEMEQPACAHQSRYVSVTLKQEELWKTFAETGNEMLLSKAGKYVWGIVSYLVSTFKLERVQYKQISIRRHVSHSH